MYIGRFAPSPTGLLHLGSLFAAVASWLDARAHQGRWLVRIEDIDPPREQAGAAQAILKMLDAYGLQADEEVVFQSQRHEAYQAALTQLSQTGQLFWCQCSRKDLQGFDHYPGTCFGNSQPLVNAAAKWRPLKAIEFTDKLQGLQQFPNLDPFVVRRRDQLWAYQLAVVVDDHAAGVNHIVRGIDLLDSTPMQISLQQALGFQTPCYAHLPVLINADGNKLSKQNLAQPIATFDKEQQLRNVLIRLGIEPQGSRVSSLLDNAIKQWSLNKLHNQKEQLI